MTFITLAPAYFWACPACRVGQYVDAVPVELNAREANEASRETGIPPHMIHHSLLTEPVEVECVQCGSVYSTEKDG